MKAKAVCELRGETHAILFLFSVALYPRGPHSLCSTHSPRCKMAELHQMAAYGEYDSLREKLQNAPEPERRALANLQVCKPYFTHFALDIALFSGTFRTTMG